MLVAKRITAFRRVTAILQQRTGVRVPYADKKKKTDDVRAASHSEGRASQRSESRRLPAAASELKEKLLFRRIPIALSLVERSILKLELQRQRKRRVEQKSDDTAVALQSASLDLMAADSSLSAMSNDQGPVQDGRVPPHTRRNEPPAILTPWLLQDLLEGLHRAEEERRWYYQELVRQGETRAEKISRSLHVAQETVEQLRHDKKRLRRRSARPPSPLSDDEVSEASSAKAVEKDLEAQVARRGELQKQQQEIVRDRKLLQHSLVARSYFSARMWRFLLRQNIWVAIRHVPGAAAQQSSGRLHIQLLWWWSRVVVGVLHDVLECHQPLASTAPRFVVSLPSRRHRRQERHSASRKEMAPSPTEQMLEDSTHATPAPEVALMLEMMGNNLPTTGGREGEREVPAISAQRQAMSPASTSRPTSSGVRRASLEDRVSLRWMPRPSQDLMPLLIATLGLWRHLLQDLDVDSVMNSSKVQSNLPTQLVSLLAAVQQVATTTLLLDGGKSNELPPLLTEMQTVLLDKVGRVRHLLHHQIERIDPASQRQTPVQAAQLLLGMHRLNALSPTSSVAQDLVVSLTLSIFPQLRTNTYETLLSKARQSSLLAFVSRSQNARLRRHAKRPESLLENATHRHRLEQRQLSAALREARLSEIQRHTTMTLSQSLLASELVTLFQLLASHVATPAEGSPRSASPETGRMLLLAAILVGEAVVVAEVWTPSASSRSPSLSLPQLANTWLAVSVLKVQLHATAPRRQRRETGTTMPLLSERHLLEVLTTQVLHAVQEQLAAVVDLDPSRIPSSSLIVALHIISTGLMHWMQGDNGAHRGNSGTHHPLQRELHSTARLMKEVLLTHFAHLRVSSEWSEESKAAFQSNMREMFHLTSLLDNAVESVILQVGKKDLWSPQPK